MDVKDLSPVWALHQNIYSLVDDSEISNFAQVLVIYRMRKSFPVLWMETRFFSTYFWKISDEICEKYSFSLLEKIGQLHFEYTVRQIVSQTTRPIFLQVKLDALNPNLPSKLTDVIRVNSRFIAKKHAFLLALSFCWGHVGGHCRSLLPSFRSSQLSCTVLNYLHLYRRSTHY